MNCEDCLKSDKETKLFYIGLGENICSTCFDERINFHAQTNKQLGHKKLREQKAKEIENKYLSVL